MLKRKKRRFTMKLIREDLLDFIKFCTSFRIFYIQKYTVIIHCRRISVWIDKQVINHFIVKIIMLAVVERQIV